VGGCQMLSSVWPGTRTEIRAEALCRNYPLEPPVLIRPLDSEQTKEEATTLAILWDNVCNDGRLQGRE
jgi:hypothetical protein